MDTGGQGWDNEPVMVERKKERHASFWCGEGPSLILIPAAEHSLYDLDDYPRRFYDPAGMWESEMARARPIVDWPTDGIPTARPNLGVTFVPAIAGQEFQLHENSMPWPGRPLSAEAVEAARDVDPADTDVFRLARAFYEIHRDAAASAAVAAYLADTQGVFDIAHLLRGDEIFFDLADPGPADALAALMDTCALLYERTTLALKAALGEPPGSMIHGHGTPQGVFFPAAGVRVAEDTATLLSPAMIAATILPAVTRWADRFGGVFAHFCGFHATFFRQLAALPAVRAIDLGNPERFETRELLATCAETGTVLCSHLAAEDGEDWRDYTLRLAGLVRDTGARVILRPAVFPSSRDRCREMLDLWHEHT